MWNIEFTIELLSIVLFTIFCLLNMMGFSMNAMNAKRQDKAIYTLASLIMIVMAVQSIFSLDLILPFSQWESPDNGFSYERVVMLVDMLLVPMIVILIRRLTLASKGKLYEIVWHMAIPIALIVSYSITHNNLIFYSAFIYYPIYGGIYYFNTLRNIRQYEEALKNSYSETKGRSLQWLVLFIHVLLAELTLWAITRPYFTTSSFAFSFYYLASICFWWWLSMMLRKQVLETSEMTMAMKGYNLSTEFTEQVNVNDVKNTLDKFFLKNKLYHQPDLTISQLALEVGLMREELMVWFMHNNTNFNAFINNLRLQDVADMLRTTNYDPFVIATSCGFTHRMNFAEMFERKYGCSPNEYRDKVTPPHK